MTKKFKIKNFNVLLVFRHKWDKLEKTRYGSYFNSYILGFFYKKNKIVGNNNFNKPEEWGKNTVNDYMIGINLIVCKAWISFNNNGKMF